MPEADRYAHPGPTTDTWRAWLMTGVRREVGDKRRIRGAHVGLKRMLVEGMKVRIDRPYSWKEFSDALVRQAVGDAVRSLPRQDAELLKLAYFGSMSNRDLSAATGVPQGTIERRLRRAIATIAEFVERGRGLGQRALGMFAVWSGSRWFHEAVMPAAQATAIAGMAAIMVIQPAPDAAPRHPVGPAAGATANATSVLPVPSPSPAPASSGSAAPQTASAVPVSGAPLSSLSSVQVPTQVSIAVPPLPQAPLKVKTPQV